MGVLPRTLLPMLGSARTKEDRQIHIELEGTRILRSSGATPHRWTVIIINNFSLNYMMCVEVGREGERNRARGRGTHGRRETDYMKVAVDASVEREEGRLTGEKGGQPEGASTRSTSGPCKIRHQSR